MIYFHKKSSFKIFNMIESCYRYRRSFKTDIVPLVNIFGKGFIFTLFWQLKNKIILISIWMKLRLYEYFVLFQSRLQDVPRISSELFNTQQYWCWCVLCANGKSNRDCNISTTITKGLSTCL